jgi:hypothetical protein
MKFLLTLLSLLIFIGCSTTPQSTLPPTDIGVWKGKVQMINTTTNQKKWASLTWASDSDGDRMRVDVSAVFDTPLVTFMKNEEGYHLWQYMDGKYYFSENGAKLFRNFTKLSVDPDLFYDFLGQPRNPGLPWVCEKTDQPVMSCQASTEKVRFVVNHAERDRRQIGIQRGDRAIHIRLNRAKVQVQDRLFKTLSTSHFKTIQI